MEVDLKSYAWTLLLPLVGVIWAMLNKQIDSLRSDVQGKLSKSEFKLHSDDNERQLGYIRREQEISRNTVGRLFDKVTEAEDKGVKRHFELMDKLFSMKEGNK